MKTNIKIQIVLTVALATSSLVLGQNISEQKLTKNVQVPLQVNPFRSIYQLLTGQRRLKTWEEIKNTDGGALFKAYASWYWEAVKAITPGYAEIETAGKMFAVANNGSFEDGAIYLADYVSDKVMDKLLGTKLTKELGITDDMLKSLIGYEIKNAISDYAQKNNIKVMTAEDIANMFKDEYLLNNIMLNAMNKTTTQYKQTSNTQMCYDVSVLTKQALIHYSEQMCRVQDVPESMLPLLPPGGNKSSTDQQSKPIVLDKLEIIR